MKRTSSILAVTVALAAPAAAAHAAEADLTVHDAPYAPHVAPSMRMRRAVAQGAPTGAAPAGSAPMPGPSDAGNPGDGRTRDLEERVIFKFSAGVALDSSPTSGQPMRNGVTPAELPGDVATGATPLRTSNTYLLGDAVLGSRGLPRASINTYLQSQFRLGIDGVSAYATRNDVWDSGSDADIQIQSAYGEIDGYGKEGDTLHPLFLRAGRQFHYGSALFATQFDGVQLGWDRTDWEASGFVGRRVSIYQGDDPGIVSGASLKVRFERLNGWPLALAVDALNFDGDRTYVETGARILVRGARLYLSARALDNGDGDGFGFGRFSARASIPVGERMLVQADGDLIRSQEVAYDYLSPNPVDVVNLSDSGIALALPEPGNSVRVGGGLLVALFGGLEAYGFGRANIADSTGFDSTWVELGAALEEQLRSGFSAGAQLKLRVNSLDDDANAPDGAFDDMAGSGVTGFQEASAELRYRPGYHTYGIAAGGWLRSYDLDSPYVAVKTDARAGGRVDADYWVEKHARVRVVAEAAQASKTFAPDLDTMYSLRLLGEATF
jgi:hypothetical protein